LETTPAFSRAIVSTSAAHRGHHARLELRLRRINKESVSMVILVCFAMNSTSGELGTRPICPQGDEEVIAMRLKISDNFSQ
jgi:hypothetical protein